MTTPNTCPECGIVQTTKIDAWFLTKAKRCNPCHKKWLALPENDPEYKKYIVEVRKSLRFVVYAKTEEEAKEKALETDDWDDVDIEEVKK